MHPLRRLLMLSCLCACAGLASAQERTPAADDDPFGAAPPAFPGRKTSPATIQPVPEATPVNTIPDDDPLLQADPSRVSNKPGARTPPPSASQRVRGAVPPSTPRAEADDGKPPPPISVDGGASVNPAVLAETKDNQLGLQDEDRTPYFRILSLAKQLPQDRLREFARQFRDQRRAAIPRYQKKLAGDFPSFVDMFLNPDV